MRDQSIHRFRQVVGVALAHLEERREEINDLNVFPVADGDTGDNMALTMRHVLDELDLLARGSDGDPLRPEIVRAVARAALMGARGNSGVILSQIVRGAAEKVATPPGRLIDPELIEAALTTASEAAYASVREPAEGTMLTVIRVMAEAVAERRSQWLRERLDPEATAPSKTRCSPRCWRPRCSPARRRSATPPSNSTCSPRPESSTPAPSAWW